MTEPRVRAGHAERQAAVDGLTHHFTQGRLTPDEFDDRVGKAYAATYLDELPELFVDLPNEGAHRSIGASAAAGRTCEWRYRPMSRERYHGSPPRPPRMLMLVLVITLVVAIAALTHVFFALPLWFALAFFLSGAARRRRWVQSGGRGFRDEPSAQSRKPMPNHGDFSTTSTPRR